MDALMGRMHVHLAFGAYPRQERVDNENPWKLADFSLGMPMRSPLTTADNPFMHIIGLAQRG